MRLPTSRAAFSRQIPIAYLIESQQMSQKVIITIASDNRPTIEFDPPFVDFQTWETLTTSQKQPYITAAKIAESVKDIFTNDH